jgi:hypothetical protein
MDNHIEFKNINTGEMRDFNDVIEIKIHQNNTIITLRSTIDVIYDYPTADSYEVILNNHTHRLNKEWVVINAS